MDRGLVRMHLLARAHGSMTMAEAAMGIATPVLLLVDAEMYLLGFILISRKQIRIVCAPVPLQLGVIHDATVKLNMPTQIFGRTKLALHRRGLILV